MSRLVDAAILALLSGILATFFLAVRRDNAAAAINAVVSLAAAILPVSLAAALATWGDVAVAVPPSLTIWLAVAGLLHCIGMLGPYESVWWYDHLTHLVSAALVAALLYAGLLALGGAPGGFEADRRTVGVLAVGLAMLAGVGWELLELAARAVGERFDVEPVLVNYGWRDTGLDLFFDLLGAVLVVVLDVRTFLPLAQESLRATRALLVTGSGLLIVGSVAMGVLLVGRRP